MDVRKVVRAKLRRLKEFQPPRVLDLFAGCGGLSLGFQRAGFDLVAALESDELAIRSHARNFYPEAGPLQEAHARPQDITAIDPAELLASLQVRGKPENAVDVIIGGPPCQAFARVGRAKLREIDEHPDAFLRDPRSNLYLRYLQYVRELAPVALLMENVPDVMNFGGHNVAEEVCDVLDSMGYTCAYTLLNASYYGVPQMRERMFLIAYRKELAVEVKFPRPSHWMQLPPGYHGSRNVALRVLVENGYGSSPSLSDNDSEYKHYYQEPPAPPADAAPAVTTADAIGDLPPLMARELHQQGILRRGARRFTEFMPYRSDREPTPFAQEMRAWPGFTSQGGVYDHVIRSLPRDYAIFAQMQPGDQYPQAHALAIELCEKERRKRRIRIDSPEHVALQAALIPPYDPGKFPNKWRKLESYLPSRTLLAHLGKDSYSHIHYDSDQARTISVREAARLQSFPDGFQFAGTMNPAFRQIGNAVPPLLAFALANQIQATLRKSQPRRTGKSSRSAPA
ncbi:DNA cytosine methyltransferase [Lignipirellula cremea]|uniref:DNA (cytosine-5-)-methyltransferase n=1 Tax=Lignipirellula cremea TaxID=2528010 RepID=A0A518DL28_9BACT|nr:DNA cytosine methyltransferase [Lignipirellula cremea]QDU92536.1 Modification methylase HaeIII [Lignipirellula cremea]